MPRRGRRADREGSKVAADSATREERTAAFSKTKMCKFHLLGVCTRGASCQFAHDREELQPLPDLFRTKLCKTLVSTGSCNDPQCRYAHNPDELRPVPPGVCLHRDDDGDSTDARSNENSPPAARTNGFHLQGFGEQDHKSLDSPLAKPGALLVQQLVQGGAALLEGGSSLVVKNTFLDITDEPARISPDRLRPVRSAAARLDMMAGPEDEEEEAFFLGWRGSQRVPAAAAEELQRVLPDQPVQINPNCLRSLSSNSLSSLARVAEDEENEIVQVPRTADGARLLGVEAGAQWVVKNTFLDFEPAIVPAGRLRPVASAAGRLDALAEEGSDQVNPPSQLLKGFGGSPYLGLF